MPHLRPQTLTRNEQQALLASTADHPRGSLLLSLALGTGLRLGELVGLNVGDVYFPGGLPRERVRVRAEIAKDGRAGDVFLPNALEREELRDRVRHLTGEHGEGKAGRAPCARRSGPEPAPTKDSKHTPCSNPKMPCGPTHTPCSNPKITYLSTHKPVSRPERGLLVDSQASVKA